VPNYCENSLVVTGPRRDLGRFVAAVEADDEVFSFTAILPDPNGLDGRDAWRTWRQMHWGTRWDASEAERSRPQPTRVVYYFETAWTPPIPVVEAAGLRWPQLRFTLSFAEPGNDFAGQVTVQGEEKLDELAGTYSELFTAADGGSDRALVDACATLPRTEGLIRTVELRSRLAAGENPWVTPGAAAPTAELLRLADYALTRDYLRHPGTNQDDVWELAHAVVLDGRGGSVLLAMRTSPDPVIATIGLLASRLGPLTSPESFQQLRRWFARAEHAGTLHVWAEAAIGLAGEWSAGDVAELLEAAWHLCD